MAGTAFKESILHARNSNTYKYRSGMGMFPSSEWVVFFDDFCQDVASNKPINWDAAIIDTGATIVSSAEHGGGLTVASDGTAEGVSIYLPKCVQLSGKKFFMEARVWTVDADDTDLQIGLSDLVATTDPEDMWDTSNTDGIAFGVLDGDATPVLVYDKNNVGPVTNTPSGTSFDLADSTWHTLGLYYNGATTASSGGYLAAYVDGNLAVSAATVAQIPEDVALAPFFGARTGGDAAHTMKIDYFRFAIQR
jgi:type 1 fimbria pilin